MLPRASFPISHIPCPPHPFPPSDSQYHHRLASTFPQNHMGFEAPTLLTNTNSLISTMDPSSVDFRAFYPYTPNEVKHRKRTTTAQLKILEGIFKRDTKPNATLRNELATQLDMTARGVQVWFQNRRAKEKVKAGKTPSAGKTNLLPHLVNRSSTPSLLSPTQEGTDFTPESTADGQESFQNEQLPELGDSSSQESSPLGASPPQLHVITDTSHASWQNSSLDTPDLTSSLSAHSNDFENMNLLAFRRGSLPVNVSAQPDHSTNGPPLIDTLDTLGRRRSVDASLHRLASNPYAHLARAKNGMLYGTRSSALMSSRPHQLNRLPYSISQRLPSGHHLDIRRSSVDPRAFRFSPAGGHSPSPSPLSSYHAVRASLPDHNLYAITSRTIVSPIPGPLPSPDFSFGAANTPSMTSPSSGDSEQNSPDSLRSFTFREEHDTEDDANSVSYGAYSRFGSIASIATSESSIQSGFYSEGGCTADRELNSSRRDSCTSGNFLGMMSGLDVNGNHQQSALVEHSGLMYPSLNETPPAISNSENSLINHTNKESAPYPSPSSTISPGASPQISDPPPPMQISRSSELAFALQSQPEQNSSNGQSYTQSNNNDVETTSQSVSRHNSTYFYRQQSEPTQNLTPPSTSFSQEFIGTYQFDPNYSPVYPSINNGYSGELDLQQQAGDFRCTPVPGIYQRYTDTIDPLSAPPMENSITTTEAFVSYT